MMRAYKTELDPNKKQATLFRKHCGTARFVYNWALADRIRTYEETGKSGNLNEQKRRFNALKDAEFPWIRETTAYCVTQEAFTHLDRAFKNFFRRLRKGEKPGFPKYKSKKRSRNTFTMRGCIHVYPNGIQLPRIGRVRLKERGYLPSENEVKILSVNISERAGRWFVSLQVEEDRPEPEPATGPAIGVDLGIKTLAVCSDGAIFESPHALVEAERKLARLNRELHRRQKGGKNHSKTRRKLARQYYKVACVRQHALHQISHYLTAKAKPSAVVIENLNVSGMLKNRHLSKAISDAAFSELRRQIEYKAAWYGVEAVVADRFYASSKTCSECGYVYKSLTLSEREWTCPECGVTHDRDTNAAMNLVSLANNREYEGRNTPGLPVELAGTKTPL